MSIGNEANEQFAKEIQEDGFGPIPGPPGYPPTEAEPMPEHTIPEDNFIPSDRFKDLNDQFPEVAAELKRRKRETENLTKQVESREAMLQEAHNKVLSTPGSVDAKPQDPWTEYTDDQLHEYLDGVDRLKLAAATNPEDDSVKAELAKIKPKHLREVRNELGRRSVRPEIENFRAEQQAQQASQNMARTAEDLIAREFGAKALMDTAPDSPLARAKEVIQEVTGQFGGGAVTDPAAVSAMAVMAMKLAHAEQQFNRVEESRRVPPSLTRQLDIEGSNRRTASTNSERSAMERRGDWDGLLLHDITGMIQNMPQ